MNDSESCGVNPACATHQCPPNGDCNSCPVSWTNPVEHPANTKARITELYDEISSLLIYRISVPKATTVSEYALDRSRSRYIDSLIADMRQLNMKLYFGGRNMIYKEMSMEELEICVAEMNSIAKEHEMYGSQIELQNALFCQECAETELEYRQTKQIDQEVEAFLETQANIRDHEYELETMHEWGQE